MTRTPRLHQGNPGSLRPHHVGMAGRILLYVRPNGRCPSREFIEHVEKKLRKRYDRFFRLFGRRGMEAADNNTFKPMTQEGKGIWSIKQHDHRLLAFRGPDAQETVPGGTTTVNQLVLLMGWVKDKSESVEERNRLESAQRLREECESCVDWHVVCDVVERAPVVPVAAVKPTRPVPAEQAPAPAPQEGIRIPSTTEKPTIVTLQALADLAGVPYGWLAHEVQLGRVTGWTKGPKGRKVWSWDGIEKVVERVEARRNRPQKPRRTPWAGAERRTIRAEGNGLLTLGRTAKAVGISKHVLRHAVDAGKIKPATIVDNIRLFDVALVREWIQGPPQLVLEEPTTERVPRSEPLAKPETSIRPATKRTLHQWLDEILHGERDDMDALTAAIRHHLDYCRSLKAELRALAEG